MINLTLIQRHIGEYTGIIYKTDLLLLLLLLLAIIFEERHGYFYLFQLMEKRGARKIRELEI